MRTPSPPRVLPLLLAILAIVAVGAVAEAKMKSKRSGPLLCETTGGGRFVKIPGFPGERIDRRLLADVRLLVRRYKLHVTDGFSTDPVHSAKGEHPLGLALDLVPDRSRGGRWKDLGRLARWAEPRQNAPRLPFRWVGYNGDSGHGRGHHLHLSWAHSARTRFGRPVRTVYSLRCPGTGGGKRGGSTGGGAGGGSKPDAKPDRDKGAKKKGKDDGRRGGVAPGKGGGNEPTGGISSRALRSQEPGRSSVETGGISVR